MVRVSQRGSRMDSIPLRDNRQGLLNNRADFEKESTGRTSDSGMVFPLPRAHCSAHQPGYDIFAYGQPGFQVSRKTGQQLPGPFQELSGTELSLSCGRAPRHSRLFLSNSANNFFHSVEKTIRCAGRSIRDANGESIPGGPKLSSK